MSNFSTEIDTAQKQRQTMARRSPYLFPEYANWQTALRKKMEAEYWERVAREKWEAVMGCPVK